MSEGELTCPGCQVDDASPALVLRIRLNVVGSRDVNLVAKNDPCKRVTIGSAIWRRESQELHSLVVEKSR